jgi:hypothetical protein
MSKRTRANTIAAISASWLIVLTTWTHAFGKVSENDTARFLAGMKPAASSPLGPLAQTRSWQLHAKSFDNAWAGLNKRRLNNIRIWSKTHLKNPKSVMYYMFSGPDFLYANTFFPHAKTYVLSGLEPVGSLPNVMRTRRYALSGALGHLRATLATSLNYSFFITKDMKTKLRAGGFTGTLPLLYIFLARADKTIHTVRLVKLNKDGTVSPQGKPGKKRVVPGVEIKFSSPGHQNQTLYYFRTDLSNGGTKRSGFLKFLANLGPGDSLVKSASYLMHRPYFSTVRKFLLTQSATLLQDDSGIPLRYFKTGNWRLQPFGKYFGPIQVFAGYYQPDMRRLFRKGRAAKATFGMGYRWRTHETNILLATK